MRDQQYEPAEELEVYRERLHEWEAMKGRFVLIRTSEVVGFYDDYTEAVRTGYEKFGIIPFLVKTVAQQRQAHNITRLRYAPQITR